MLKGLEITEIHLKDLERTGRLDSEFYKKENLDVIRLLNKNKSQALTDFVDVSDGNHMGISEYFCDEGVPYYRGQDIHDFFIENANPICIPKTIFSKPVMKRSHLKKNDVLLSIVGTIGEVSLVNTESDATCSCKLAILRPNSCLKAETIALFLQSKYGYNQIRKFIRGAVQMGFILEDVDQIIIPNFSPAFQSQIEQIVKSAHSKLAESKSLYAETEEILLSELGLKDWQPKKESVSVKSFSDFAKSGRLDAEYYQPKYDELFNHLLHYNCVKLGDIVSIKKSVEPGSESYIAEGIPFIRVSDVSKFEISKTDLHLSPKEFDLKALRPHKDTILFSKDGSIGIAYKCQKDLNVITSGALLHLDVRDETILPDYLTIVLNSMVTKLQAERDSNGAIIQHWKPEDIKKVIIPVLSMQNQSLIAEKIQKSFDLRKESKELLESAKRMVEEEIEK